MRKDEEREKEKHLKVLQAARRARKCRKRRKKEISFPLFPRHLGRSEEIKSEGHVRNTSNKTLK
jgi:hypothetical protein